MSIEIPVTAVPTSTIKRDYANFHPTIWGDYFLSHVSHSKTTDNTSIQQQHDVLKEEVRSMLKNHTCHPFKKLQLIDVIQRIGIAYHFKIQIEESLEKIHHQSNHHHTDLRHQSLRFRLLRQQGIKVSCDIFEEFKDSEGKFKKSLINDVEGLLSLYQAAFLGIRGEDLLDEAIDFCTTNLQLILPKLSPNLAKEVSYALNRPIRKCMQRLEARHFISMYEQDESHDQTLLKFAKLDFNLLQEKYQKELSCIVEWWKILDCSTKLPYARDRIVECYFWIAGVYFEPQYCFGREMLTKIMAMLSIIDDTYDNYATYEELVLLTDAFQRWDVKAIDTLPEYMKPIFYNTLEVYNKIEAILEREGRSFCFHYAKESLKKAVQFFLVEVKWRYEGYIPTMEEHMIVSHVTTCYPLLGITSFLGMGEIATKDVFEWVWNDPKIVRASAIICRLMDDIVTHQLEQKRDHVASSVECYIKQHGISEEETVKVFRKEIANAWKDINEECLKPTPVPMDLLERFLNLTSVMDVLYKDEDGYSNPYLMKHHVASVLKDPLIIN